MLELIRRVLSKLKWYIIISLYLITC